MHRKKYPMKEIMELDVDSHVKIIKQLCLRGVISFPLGIYAEEGLLDHTIVHLLVFWESPYCFP